MIHNIHVIGDDELAALNDENRVIGYYAEASDAGVAIVLGAPIDDDGRTEWRWVRLIDGTLMLAVYPLAATYEALDSIVAADFADNEARANRRERFKRLRKLVRKSQLAAYGDSNDRELDSLRDALDEALGLLDINIRELTDDEIEKAGGL